MKVVCVKNKYSCWSYDLTIGKSYNSLWISIDEEEYYRVIDNSNKSILCESCCFLTLEEYRDKRLKEIGI